MASAIAKDLRSKSDAALTELKKQLQGMEPFMERPDASGEWTTREVLSHLLGAPGGNPVDLLKIFATPDLPVIDLEPGVTHLSDERRRMMLGQFLDSLDAKRKTALAYVNGLSDADLEQRKARIPVLKQFFGTDEFSIAMFAGALFDGHWRDHAGQIAKIRKAVGLPEAK